MGAFPGAGAGAAGVSLEVVGVGLGRTGTHSLKLGLEQLLGRPCYHMFEVFEHPEHVPIWHRAARGEPVDWNEIFGGFVATVDWPGAAFWRELTAAAPPPSCWSRLGATRRPGGRARSARS